MPHFTSYENHTVKELIEAFKNQQEAIEENAAKTFRLLDCGYDTEEQCIKNLVEIVHEDKQEQMKIAIEFIRRFI